MNRMKTSNRFRSPYSTIMLSAMVMAAFVCQSAAKALAAADDGTVIAPYIDEGTFLVARLDVDKVDHETLGKFIRSMIAGRIEDNPQVPENIKAQIEQQTTQAIETAKTWLTDMNAAGAKRVYILVDQADQQNGPGGPVVIVPTGEGVDAEKVREILTRNNGGGRQTIADIGNAVVLAGPNAVERIRAVHDGGKPAARPDLAAALAEANDVPLRLAYVPGESTRASIEHMLPQLPPNLGGGNTAVLSRGVKLASLGITQKPDVAAKFTIHATDAEQAKALLDVFNKALARAKEMAAAVPGGALTKQLESVQPTLEGNKITTSVAPHVLQLMVVGLGTRSEVRAAPAPQPGQAQPAPAPTSGDGL